MPLARIAGEGRASGGCRWRGEGSLSVKPRIVIERRKRPWWRAAWIGLAASALAVTGYGIFLYARESTVLDFRGARTELDEVQAERRRLARELTAARDEAGVLRSEVAYLKQGANIDTQAHEEVEASLQTLQTENAELRQQVAQYRGVVSPEEAKAGLRVTEFRLAQGADERRWRFDLVLAQSQRNNRAATGVAEIRIEGKVEGKKKVLGPPELFAANAPPLKYSFKYSQEFSGELILPEGFQPDDVTVTLAPSGKDAAHGRHVAEFDWARVAGPGRSES